VPYQKAPPCRHILLSKPAPHPSTLNPPHPTAPFAISSSSSVPSNQLSSITASYAFLTWCPHIINCQPCHHATLHQRFILRTVCH
jgi:hypothetical protein